MSKLSDWLDELNACGSAVKWAEKYNSLPKAWRECRRADWLLWLAGKMADKPGWPTRKEMVLVACDCAETALKHVPDGEDRPRIAIEITRKWASGDESVGLEDVRSAAYAAAAAAYAADDAAAAAYAAAYAAAAAAYAAAYAAAAYATAAAAYAADAYAAAAAAAAAAYAAAAYAAAADAADASMATIIRRRLKPGNIS